MNPGGRWASFTLVEMLVGVAIFSILVLFLFAVTGDVIKLWRQQTAKEEGFREARAALNALSHDMSGALITTNVDWFYSSTNQLAFLTTLPDTAQGITDGTNLARGDICAVGYSLEWGTNDASGVQTNMSLYRYVSFSDSTYANIIETINTPIESIFSNPDGVNTVRNLIARNVVQISFVSYTNDDSGVPQVCPNPKVLPDMLDVAITTLNDKTATLLTKESEWLNTNSLLIQQNEESFTLRVRTQQP